MRSRFQKLAPFALTLFVWACVTPTHAAEIKVLSAGAMKGMVTDLAETFRQETGHTVVISSGTAGEIRQKVTAGDPADVVFVTDTVLEQLAATNMVVADSRADIAHTGIGVAAARPLARRPRCRCGQCRPDISTPEAFKQTILAAKSLVYTNPALGATSGIHFASVLQRLGIADAVKDKTVLWPGAYAAEALLKGQADLCVHHISE